MEREIACFNLAHITQPRPSIEIDMDCSDDCDYRTHIEQCLAHFARQNPKVCSSVYDYVGPSLNFMRPTMSIFFVSDRSALLLKYIYETLRSLPGVRMRWSDYVPPSQCQLAYHVENGEAWMILDMATLLRIEEEHESDTPALGDALEVDEADGDDEEEMAHGKVDFDDDEFDITELEDESVKIGEICRKIADEYDIPVKSVKFCNPDGSFISNSAFLNTLKKRWREN